MKLLTPALLTAALLLTGCNGGSEPSAPPTGDDALTTSSVSTPPPATLDAEPTTQAPPDDVGVTTEPGDAVETTEAGGPPELPDEARENSESGAEAFALHYIDVINYTSTSPEVGLLEPLAADGCESCENHEATVAYSVENGHVLRQDLFAVAGSVSLHDPIDSIATVRVDVSQVAQEVFDPSGRPVDTINAQDGATMVFSLSWHDGWRVDELRAELSQS